jgi:hypothetical protein
VEDDFENNHCENKFQSSWNNSSHCSMTLKKNEG